MPATDVNLYVTEFERFEETTGRDAPSWLRAIRRDAIARFTGLGFPTTRQEEWRFTNVAPIAERSFRLAAEPADAVRRDDLADVALPGAIEIVFVNGRFAPHLSGEPTAGVSVRSLADVLKREPARLEKHLARYADAATQPFVALNTAFIQDGALVELAANTVADRPLHIVFVTDASDEMVHPRVLVLAGRNSQVSLVESYLTVTTPDVRRPGFTNAVTELILGEGAVVDHYRIQRENDRAFHMSTTQVRVGRSGNFSSHAFTFGGAIVRNDVNVRLAGEGGDCTLNGLYVVDGSRLVDNHTVIDHAEPHCGSHEIYKGILGGRARAVFNGKILVRPDAQKTDAKQTNKTLLLSDDAQINTKPQLEIFANDVKCTHGATVGQLSEDALFYLQARGIDRRAAREMLVRAFAADITSRVKIEALRERLDAALALHQGFAEPAPRPDRLPATEGTEA